MNFSLIFASINEYPIEKLSKIILVLYSLSNLLLKRHFPLYFQSFNSLTKISLYYKAGVGKQAEEQYEKPISVIILVSVGNSKNILKDYVPNY